MSHAARPHEIAYYLKLTRQHLAAPKGRKACVELLKEDPAMRARYRAAIADLTALLAESEESRSR